MEQEPILIDNEVVTPLTSKKNINSSFIGANTKEVSFQHLQHDCIIPVFSKDNESTISHQEFIDSVYESAQKFFSSERIKEPEIRVSHEIKGRIPEAIGKPAKDLLEHEKTIYYERAAFIVEVPSIRSTINGNELSLTIGGVRAYNQENLYSKKTFEKFKVFIGFKNSVCCNLCVSTDGYLEELKADSLSELKLKVAALLHQYNIQQHLTALDSLGDYELTQKQFCQFIGRSRLYQYLPKEERQKIPFMSLNDGQISSVAKAYYEDINFAARDNGSITLWKLYNLFTGASKSSYIDSFLDRTCNAYQLTQGFVQAIEGSSNYKWFLQ